MDALARIRTIRGLSPSTDEIDDEDILEVDGDAPPQSRRPSLGMSVPPPSGKRYVPTTRYSLVVPRRRKTLRLVGEG